LVTRTLLALGFVGAIAMASAAPALAQGVYIGPGGAGVTPGDRDGVSGTTEITTTLTSGEGSVDVELLP
jgi:hypothetical protein